MNIKKLVTSVLLVSFFLVTFLEAKNGAGILPYSTRINSDGTKELVLLFRQDNTQRFWSDFGGFVETKDGAGDDAFKKAAVREGNEESYEFFNFTLDHLKDAPFLKNIFPKSGDEYRTYLVQVPFSRARDVLAHKSKYLKAHPSANNESTNFIWISQDAFLKKIQEQIPSDQCFIDVPYGNQGKSVNVHIRKHAVYSLRQGRFVASGKECGALTGFSQFFKGNLPPLKTP